MRFVTVNMFETVFDEITWDIHGSQPFTDIERDVEAGRAELRPGVHAPCSRTCSERGLLSNTMVTAMGEFGRTPKINPAGGRDHHPGVWTILMGGGPIKGGRVVGESDELGYAPKTRPVTPGEVAATLYRGWASTRTRSCPARRTGRCRWSTTASSRSRSCSDAARPGARRWPARPADRRLEDDRRRLRPTAGRRRDEDDERRPAAPSAPPGATRATRPAG